MKYSQKLLAGVVGILLLGGLTASRLWSSGNAPAATPSDTALPVTAATVTAHDVPVYLSGIGSIQAFNTVTIRPRVDGEITNIAFHEGQEVRKGELLLQIDPRPYQAALDNALALLAKDQAALATARRDLVRYQETANKGYTSRQQFETQTSLVDSAAATVQADAATVENARVQLGYANVTSPLDGVAGLRLVDQGNIVHASEAAGLVVITQMRPISAVFTVPQDSLPKVLAARAKGALTVTAMDGDATQSLAEGTLEVIDNQIDQTTGMVRLKAKFPNDAQTLWPGEFVTIRLKLGSIVNGLTVPTRAIERGPAGFFAFVIKSDNTVEARPVTIGQDDAGQTLVTAGLKAGERVVIDGQVRLQPGAAVQAVAETEAPPDGAIVR
jgi:multidrug efflux system membrane fusion protein